MALAKPLTTIFQYIEDNQENFLERLKNAIAIQSVSTSEKNIHDMINWTSNLLNSFEVQTELRNIYEDSHSGQTPLPPILLGNLERGYCPNKATVLIYGHLDVKDAQIGDGWKNEPFELFEDDGFFYGRGVLSKCPLASWINALEAYHSSGIDFPVNIKFIFESLGTQSSSGLKEILLAEKDKFLANVDYICISEGSWLQPETPCLIKSTKGICCFLIEVESAVKNLDSDICGGMVQEAMTDLLFLLQSLVDEKGNLNISSTQLDTTIADDDLEIYETVNFNLNNFLNSIGAHSPAQIGDKREILKHKLNLPTITIHDIKTSCIESTDSEIPGSVNAKVSIRTVYSQNAVKVFESIQQYLQNVWSQKGSQNKMKITLEKSLNGWHSDTAHDHIQVGVKALNYVYDMEPWFLNSGYNMPAVNILTEVFKRNIIVLPLGSGENYDINENFQCLNYYNSSKVLAAYLYEMGELPRLLSESSSSFTSCTSCPSVAEACVCGRFLEKVEPASGDTENCICSDGVCSPKSTSDLKEVVKDELKPDGYVYRNDREPIIEGVIVDEPIIEEEEDEGEEEEISEETEPDKTFTEEESKSKSPLLSKICECPLISLESSPKAMVGEIISLTSNASVLSRDPTPVAEPEKPKKEIVPSVETLRCSCTPKLYRNVIRQKSITPEEQRELMKSMRAVGSELSGISAGESQPDLKTTKTVTMGCVCPEKSADTVFEQSRQIERMLCPIKTIKKEETCTKGGKRKHHIIGPAPVEGDSEISLGPVSHCSCSSEELIVVTCCDCETKKSNSDVANKMHKEIPKNMPEAVSKEIIEEIREEIPPEVNQDIPMEVPQEAPQEIPQEVPQEIPQDVPQEIPQEVPQEIPQEVAQNIPMDVPQEIPKDIPEISPEIPNEIAQENPNEVQASSNLEDEVD